VEAVSAEDVRNLAHELYQPDKLVAVAIGPEAHLLEGARGILGGKKELVVKAG
jgi:predicted Zn-dependent peptidase